jgi:8-oxo-dGTP diphosphatase
MRLAPNNLRFAAIAVDTVIFSFIDGRLCVLLGQVNRPPHYAGVEAFIGGIVEVNETAEDAVKRHLKNKAGLQPNQLFLEQLYTFSALNRDKRNRVISVSYLGCIPPMAAKKVKGEGLRWSPVDKIPSLAYDHNEMANTAKGRLSGKLEYTNIARFLLSQEFTLTELQSLYEQVLERELDKRNFRKKILSLGILKETGNKRSGMRNRPAALYSFVGKDLKTLPSLV